MANEDQTFHIADSLLVGFPGMPFREADADLKLIQAIMSVRAAIAITRNAFKTGPQSGAESWEL
jgi:hypothetical protein